MPPLPLRSSSEGCTAPRSESAAAPAAAAQRAAVATLCGAATPSEAASPFAAAPKHRAAARRGSRLCPLGVGVGALSSKARRASYGVAPTWVTLSAPAASGGARRTRSTRRPGRWPPGAAAESVVGVTSGRAGAVCEPAPPRKPVGGRSRQEPMQAAQAAFRPDQRPESAQAAHQRVEASAEPASAVAP